jgi:hypothetical protein
MAPFMAAIKQMPVPPVVENVGGGVPHPQTAHDGCDPDLCRAQQQMEMVGDHGPGIASGACRGQYQAYGAWEAMAVLIIIEDLAALHSAGDQMMAGSLCI